MTNEERSILSDWKHGTYKPGPPAAFAGPSRSAWQCDLGNGEWDHDWQEKHDSSGEVDGGPGDHWSWRECRVCGAIETPNEQGQARREKE